MSHFYLSHVRRVDEEWVAAFFRDLCTTVGDRTGRPPESVGVRGGPHSLDAPLDLLSASTVLVALHSPRYFSQSYCVAEWTYFQQRLDVHWSRTGRRADAVVPVMWEPDPAHPLGTAFPYPPLAVPSQSYQRDGVLHLLRLKARYQRDYEGVLNALADRITAAREQLPEVHGFDAAGIRTAARPAVPPGSRAVSFVMASAAESELPVERRSRQYYGETPWNGRPMPRARARHWSPW